MMLAVLFLLQGGVSAKDDTLTIALDKSLPGKSGYRTCDVFARVLYKRLTKAGGEAYYIVYKWKSMDEGWMCHAIVVCRDAKGQYLGMDQSKQMPLLLPGKSPEEWIQWFNGPGQVELVRSITEKKLFGKHAELGPKAEKKSAATSPSVNKAVSRDCLSARNR